MCIGNIFESFVCNIGCYGFVQFHVALRIIKITIAGFYIFLCNQKSETYLLQYFYLIQILCLKVVHSFNILL